MGYNSAEPGPEHYLLFRNNRKGKKVSTLLEMGGENKPETGDHGCEAGE